MDQNDCGLVIACLVSGHELLNEIFESERLDGIRETTQDAIEDPYNLYVALKHPHFGHIDWTQDTNLIEEGIDENTLHRIQVEVYSQILEIIRVV